MFLTSGDKILVKKPPFDFIMTFRFILVELTWMPVSCMRQLVRDSQRLSQTILLPGRVSSKRSLVIIPQLQARATGLVRSRFYCNTWKALHSPVFPTPSLPSTAALMTLFSSSMLLFDPTLRFRGFRGNTEWPALSCGKDFRKTKQNKKKSCMH